MYGNKIGLINTMDKMMADMSSTQFTIDILLTKSPIKKVKCGAISVYRQNNEIEGINWKEEVDPALKLQAQQEMKEMTQVLVRKPEMFKETQQRWIPWAIKRALKLFDELKTDADIIVKSPKLKVRHVLKRNQILAMRKDPKLLFKTAFDIDALLEGDFSYDPWSTTIRRGRIGADIK